MSNQSSFIFAAIVIGFVFYVTVRGQGPAYLKVLGI